MSNNKLFILIVLLFICFFKTIVAEEEHCQAPKLTVVIVVDQLAHHTIQKILPKLKFGLKNLMNKGIIYHKAYHPHGVPETAPGHHAISTGTLPKYHGVVLNQWINRKGLKIHCETDDCKESAVFSPTGTYQDDGKSAHKTNVDGLSDQFVINSCDECTHKAYALSLKSYPAISMANRLGKAVWIDFKTGLFTSSKAYFDELPEWIKSFNKNKEIDKLTHCTWKTMYPIKSKIYQFKEADNYDFAGLSFSMIDKKIFPLVSQSNEQGSSNNSKNYDLFCKTPASSKYLLSLAKHCVEKNLDDKKEKMLLWVSLSNMDLLGHTYGPDSRETIDLVCHIDKQIGKFIKYLKNIVNEKDMLIVLTADHGICPIPEIMNKRGLTQARRIMAPDLIDRMNKKIKENFGIEKIVTAYEPTHFRLNNKILSSMPDKDVKAIFSSLKELLLDEQGIKNVWSIEELNQSISCSKSYKQFYQNQVFRKRTGDIVVQPLPYVQITHYPRGTSHMTPYDYDTHVPLVIYQKGKFEKTSITKRIWMQQLPVTLAYLFGLQQPSSSLFNILPGIKKIQSTDKNKEAL